MSRYALPLKDPAAAPPAAAGFLAGTPGYTPDTARHFLRTNPGFLGRSLPLEQARDLAARAAAAGLETLLVTETDLPAPPPAAIVEKVELQSGGFYARTASLREFIPYESVTILAGAAYLAAPAPRNMADLKPPLFYKLAVLAGLPAPEPPQPRLETFLRADLIGGEGPQRLLLRPEALDFSSLPLRAPSSEANFRTLLGELAANSLRAVKNHALAAILAGAPLAPLRLASAAAADLELSRLLLLAANRGG